MLMIAPRLYRVATLLWNAQRARAAGNPAQAAQGFASAAEIIPWRTRYWEQAGHAALQVGDPQAAVTYFSKAASLDLLTPAGTLALGDACLQNGDMDCAARWWDTALRAGLPAGELYARLLPILMQEPLDAIHGQRLAALVEKDVGGVAGRPFN